MQGPLSENGTGRVEVLSNGLWGTICDVGWSIEDARVACRQLGYPDAVRFIPGGQVPSRTSGPVWLSNVACTGQEQNLTSCSHDGWGNNACPHSRDAGIECSTTGNAAINRKYSRLAIVRKISAEFRPFGPVPCIMHSILLGGILYLTIYTLFSDIKLLNTVCTAHRG